MTFRRAFLIFAICAGIALAGNASAKKSDSPFQDSKRLPDLEEPSFESVRYAEVEKSVVFRVSLSSREIAAAIGARLNKPQRLEPYQFSLADDAPIKVGTSYFRRVLYSYYPTACRDGYHGPCVQQVAVWLLPDGTISQVYVSKVIYPV